MFRSMTGIKDRLRLLCAQSVGGCSPIDQWALVLTDTPLTGPTLVRPDRDADHCARRREASSFGPGIGDQLDGVPAIRGADHDSWSPQIAPAFFDSVNSAAVSARVAFLRFRSRSNSRMRSRCALASSASWRRSCCDRLAACSKS